MKDQVIPTHAPNVVDQVAESASRAIHTTQLVADKALGGLDDKLQHLREQTSPRYDEATERMNALAQQGVQSVRDTTQRLRDSALHMSEGTRHYVREEPVKSLLFAAAAGALLMGLASLLARSGSGR